MILLVTRHIQGGKKSLSVAITDEFYIFDLMNFKVKKISFSHCILFIMKVKLFQAT